jgi:DNA-binding transcriptional regulator YdaS (Cro superfamily)
LAIAHQLESGLSPSHFARLMGIDERKMRRWMKGAKALLAERTKQRLVERGLTETQVIRLFRGVSWNHLDLQYSTTQAYG